MGATENAGFIAKVQRIAGTNLPMVGQAAVLPLCKKATVRLQKQKLLYDDRSVMRRRRHVAAAGGAPRV